MKINKACDLSSISVLPPHARRSSGVNNEPDSSIFGKSQAASQIRSQQSFSQGVSSQHGAFSQLTQNSSDEVVMNDQRFGSQEKENSTTRLSVLPPINNTREESQMQLSRPSKSLMRKWNSGASDQRCQNSEELEYRIRMMETSLSRFGMILDSVQSDIMQVNKGRREVALDMESIRQKLNANDNTLQLMNKGQEDVKVCLDRAMNSICEQLSHYAYRKNLQEVFSLLSALPEKIEAYIQKLQNDLRKSFTKEMQEMACSLQIPKQKLTPTVHPPKAISHRVTSQARPSINKLARDFSSSSEAARPKVQQVTAAPKIEMGTWNSVKHGQATCTNGDSNKGHKQKLISPAELERQWKVNSVSDEEMDGDFCCLLEGKETDIGNFSIQEAREETERILRKARRRKRKYSNAIIIN